jgi:hypothetical protein
MGYSLAASPPGEIEGATVSLRKGSIEIAAQAYHNNDPAYAPPYWEDCTPEMKLHYRTVSEAAVDAILDYLEANRHEMVPGDTVVLADLVALDGLSGLIAALRIQENQP